LLIGYGRVSTEEQDTRSQREQLTAVGCTFIFEEKASGGDRSRPELAHALSKVKRGDTLVVTRIDRLARSLSHLLQVIETLRSKGAHFRSLADPIDTSSPQGIFTLQVLGAAAEFERALVRERTMAGLASARMRGRIGGNPGLRTRDPAALAKIKAGRQAAEVERLAATSYLWLPTVERLRPLEPWPIVTRAVQQAHAAGGWTQERLVRATRRLVQAGKADVRLLDRAPQRLPQSKSDDVLRTIGAFLTEAPGLTLTELKRVLEHHRIRPPSLAIEWSISTLARMVTKARRVGLAPVKPSRSSAAYGGLRPR
jgi:DNA invertase Pin-like site-specific DNA recombinase